MRFCNIESKSNLLIIRCFLYRSKILNKSGGPMTIRNLAFILFLPIQLLFAQEKIEWINQNPHLAHEGFHNLWAFDKDKIIALGFGGTVVTTDDSGKKWNVAKGVIPNVTNNSIDLPLVHFFNDGSAIASQRIETFYRTDDYGKTWKKTEPLVRRRFISLSEQNSNTLWGINYFENDLYISTDKGKKFSFVTNAPADQHWKQVHFIDEKNGWLISDGEYTSIYKTDDGAKTWTLFRTDLFKDYYFNSMFILDENHCWIVVSGKSISNKSKELYFSKDGGKTWNLHASKYFEKLYFFDKHTGFAIHRDQLVNTVDGGKTWENVIIYDDVFTNKHVSVNSFKFVDRTHGWAVGSGGTILKTVDGGKTWKAFGAIGFGEMGKVRFHDTKNGYALNKLRKQIIITDNGGKNWSLLKADFQSKVKDFHTINKNEALVVGLEGLLSHTFDKGKTWNTIPLPTKDTIHEVFSIDGRTIWCHNQTVIYKSTDKGKSWKQFSISPSSQKPLDLNHTQFMTPKIGYTQHYGYNLYKTIDGGETWTDIYKFKKHINSLYFIDENNGWIGLSGIEEDITIKRTTDGGKTWVPSYKGGEAHHILDFHFFNAKVGWATGDRDLLYTKDGGESWTKLKVEDERNWITNSIYFTDEDHGWIVGTKGLIYQGKNSTIPLTHSVKSTNSASFFIQKNKQISFINLPTHGNYNLKIYSLSGKTVYNENVNSKTVIKLKPLSDGIYTLVLQGSNLNKQKTILVK